MRGLLYVQFLALAIKRQLKKYGTGTTRRFFCSTNVSKSAFSLQMERCATRNCLTTLILYREDEAVHRRAVFVAV